REKNSNRRKYSTNPVASANISTSLHRATDILSCLSNGINTVTDVANYCRYSTSTVHRLLQTLKDLNWAVQDENNHQYYLGSLVTQLSSNQAAAHRYLIMKSLREMMRMSNITGETVNLAVMLQLHYMLLHEVASEHALRITEASKLLGQIYIGATAKVLLSQLPDAELKRTLRHIKFNRVTENTVTDKDELMEQLTECRQKGYCVTYGERIPGAVCISAPIKNYMCPASLSIVGPENRLRARVDEVIEELKESAGRISGEIVESFVEKEVVND
ncbi:MAG: IclR family transcriptional regulator, partial [Dehalococcoidales bacterium]|nr:IclR family transcriptional regulator [Dehalococcoidales bacterium]